MTERERQRRLHVANRLAELNAKLGPLEPLEDWGEAYFSRWFKPPPPRPARPAARRQRRSKQTQLEGIAKLDGV